MELKRGGTGKKRNRRETKKEKRGIGEIRRGIEKKRRKKEV